MQKSSYKDVDFLLDPTLALYLPLYHTDGASLQSRGKYGRTCPVVGAKWTTQGRYFDRTDDKITLPQAVSQALTGQSCATLLMWVNQAVIDGTPQRLFNLYNSAGVYKFGLATTTIGTPQGNVVSNAEPGKTAEGAAISAGKFNLVGMVVDLPAQTIHMWSNVTKITTTGLAFAQSTFADSVYPEGNDRIGLGRLNTYGFGGIIGEVALWTRRLTDPEYHNYRMATRGRFE